MAVWQDVPALTNSMSSDILAMSSNFGLLRSAFAATTAPSNPVQGQVWYKDLGSNLYERYTYNGIAWVEEFTNEGINITEGSNKIMGVATLVGGTITVSNTRVTANSRIFLSSQNGLSNGFVYVSARVVGTSFTITSLDGNDGSNVAYLICEPTT